MESSLIQRVLVTLVALYSGKVIWFGANLSDALIVIAMCSLVGVLHIYNHSKFKEYIQSKFDTQQLDIDTIKKSGEEVKTYVTSVKLNNQRIGTR